MQNQQYMRSQFTQGTTNTTNNHPNVSITDYLQPNQFTNNDMSRLSHQLDHTRMNDSALAEQRYQKLTDIVQPLALNNLLLRNKSEPRQPDESYLQHINDRPSANQILLENLREQQLQKYEEQNGETNFVSVSPKANSSTFPSKTHQPVIKRNSSSRSSLRGSRSLIGLESRNGENNLHSNRGNDRSKSHRSVSSRRSRTSAMTENPKENEHSVNYRAQGVDLA